MAIVKFNTSIPSNIVALNQATSAFDAFGRLRTSSPLTLFDSKLLKDKSSLFWDEATVSGSGFTSSHLINALENSLRLGSTIGGVSDQIVLAVRSFSIGLDVAGTLTWRELI